MYVVLHRSVFNVQRSRTACFSDMAWHVVRCSPTLRSWHSSSHICSCAICPFFCGIALVELAFQHARSVHPHVFTCNLLYPHLVHSLQILLPQVGIGTFASQHRRTCLPVIDKLWTPRQSFCPRRSPRHDRFTAALPSGPFALPPFRSAVIWLLCLAS